MAFSMHAQIQIQLPKNQVANNTDVTRTKEGLLLSWPLKNGSIAELNLNFDNDKPLFSELSILDSGKRTSIAESADPVFLLNEGSRTLKPENGWTIFFDKVHTRPYESHVLKLNKKSVEVSKNANRTVVSISEITSPSFSGKLELTIYNGIPLFNIAAVISTDENAKAVLYDAGLTFESATNVSYLDNANSRFETAEVQIDSATNKAVKFRTALAHGEKGALAIFPPPHQYFYPLDEAFNLKSVWHGKNYRDMVGKFGVGIRHEPDGDNRFVPWFNAPPKSEQRLNFFAYLGSESPETVLEEIKKFTNGDTYRPLENHKTLSSHFHNEFIINVVRAGKEVPEKPEFVDVFKDMGVDIVHLGEFHYTAHPQGPDSLRLQELKALFDMGERWSDDEFLLLPGEEPNEFLGGHYMAFFPKPVYWIMARSEDQPFVSEVPDFGKVYRIGNSDEMLKLLELENGLVWTAHPRIKGSTGYPDAYKNETFFKSDRFLGGAWKAMPADLSTPKLGLRVLDLLDDMNNWGHQKKVLAEADLFTISFENEMYAHMNVNYLKMPNLPSFSEGWGNVLDQLSQGSFFSTTGEIRIPAFKVDGKESGESLQLKNGEAKIDLELDWTFPLNFIEIISGDGNSVFRERIDMNHTNAFGTDKFSFEAELKNRKWVRIEVWDVAANGAFTQTVYLKD
ncbi:hypothetical protein [Pseudozobellia sp. WGM2]|uniref:hypothetical protein n=1 Tax=Pseudozobellia sp. WGM2 TaxID=2787625 RepID=UPI001AE001FF|nr:hypothetical protein [Pseudozobellia sp. WGM2]